VTFFVMFVIFVCVVAVLMMVVFFIAAAFAATLVKFSRFVINAAFFRFLLVHVLVIDCTLFVPLYNLLFFFQRNDNAGLSLRFRCQHLGACDVGRVPYSFSHKNEREIHSHSSQN